MPDRRRWFDLENPDSSSPDVAIVGVPYDGSTSLRRGAKHAPDVMRELSRTADAITRKGRALENIVVRDAGDVHLRPPEQGPPQDELPVDEIRRSLLALAESTFPIVVGGDNSVSIGALDAFVARHGRDVGVVWFDAHPDLFAAYDGDPSSHASALRTPLERHGLDPERVALLGVRSFGREELDCIQARNVQMITSAEWHTRSTETIARCIEERMRGCRAVYLAVDIDGFDAAAAPGTGYPMPGGVQTERVFQLFDALFERLPIRAMDVTEVAPPLDIGNQTSFLALQVILETFGNIR